jgi:hypothetical protein
VPPLLLLEHEADYRQHFYTTYCNGEINTHDGIRVYFRTEDFDHAFFESTMRDGVKDATLSKVRAERMNWIASTLADPASDRFQGWLKKEQRYDPTRCVSVVHGDFVVVLRFGKRKDASLRANFVTCYEADNSIGKIRQSPLWIKEDCLNSL